MRPRISYKNLRIALICVIMLLLNADINSFIQYLFLLVLIFYLFFSYKKKNYHNSIQKKYINLAIISIVLFIIIIAVQFATGSNLRYLEISESKINNLIVLTKVTIGMISIILLRETYYDTDFWIRLFKMFIIIYSTYYLISELMAGISLVRESAGLRYSKNHVSAVVYTVMPLFLFYIKSNRSNKSNKTNKSFILTLALSIITILISSSRTGYAALAIIICTSVFAFFNFRYLLISIVGVVTFFFVLNSNMALQRGFSFFSGLDTTRSTLSYLAIEKFSNYNMVCKLFGSGSNKVSWLYNIYEAHNFYLEMLLAFGIIGVIVFFSFLITLCAWILRRAERDKKIFVVQELLLTGFTAYIQPIYTSSYLCGFLFYTCLMIMMMYKTTNETKILTNYQKRRK